MHALPSPVSIQILTAAAVATDDDADCPVFDEAIRRLEAERRRIEEERAAVLRKKAIEEKRKKIAEEKERLEAEKAAARQAELEREEAKKTLAMLSPPSVSTDNATSRDGRFIAYSNGTVLDTRTNLMWATKDNGSNVNAGSAKEYCDNYRGGGYTDWRMPTLGELAELYDNTKIQNKSGSIHLSELIVLTSCCLWASETFDISDNQYVGFHFDSGAIRRYQKNYSTHLYSVDRVLPERSVK